MKVETAKTFVVLVCCLFLLGYFMFFPVIDTYARMSPKNWFWTSKTMAITLTITIATITLCGFDLILSRLH